tara:strand:+ start:101 stop:436 length:336 start_codon:yes stop_codon:yes gene_type:complete
MLKINCLLLTVSLSFFSLFLFKTEYAPSFKTATPTHKFENDCSLNTCAIVIPNSYEELIHFDKQNSGNHCNFFKPLNRVLLENNLLYLKACNFFDVNLTIDKIVFPFHSFL